MKLIVNKILLKGTTNSSFTTILKDVRDNEKAWSTATLKKSSTIKINIANLFNNMYVKNLPICYVRCLPMILAKYKNKMDWFFLSKPTDMTFWTNWGQTFLFSREVHYVEGWKWKKPEHYLNLPYVVEVQ